MHNIYETFEDESNDSPESKDDDSIKNIIKKEFKFNNIKKISVDSDNNDKILENKINDKPDKKDLIDESNKSLNIKNIKDYYDYIFYNNRKFLLDKNNLNYQKNNKGIKYRIYKCEFWSKNESIYQKIKKINTKNKNIKSSDIINGFCRGEIK